MAKAALFEPIRVRNFNLSNRIVIAIRPRMAA
jgi:2,4-dienoyl-CoA reductase-like NADH-dependent reductase (Old Yellow Enzyme family)